MNIFQSNSLSAAIKKEARPPALGRILAENNICKIGVHPFFISNIADDYLPNKAGMKNYFDYMQNLAGFFGAQGSFSNCAFILENPLYSPKTAKSEFEKSGLNFNPQTVFFSPNGKIYAYTLIGALAEDSTSKFFGITNTASHSFAAISNMINSSSGIFVFGMFEGDCVQNAIKDLYRISASFGSTKPVYKNSLIVKDYHDFYPI